MPCGSALFTEEGKTPVLDREEARALLAGIDTGSLTGLRDRALIGMMIYVRASRRGPANERE